MSSEHNLAFELARFDGIAQAGLVRKREVTPRELIEGAIDRIEASDQLINAVIHRRFDRALEEADAIAQSSDAPFLGVPFLVKDTGGATQAGVPQTSGNIALKRMLYTPGEDAPLGRRFRASGLITVGVSNAPEFGLSWDTQPLAFGPTRNPWSRDRSVCGSSGGAAAAVAVGFVPVAQGGDSGGSIRGPAAWCGVFGLKPSRGLVPRPVDSIVDIWYTPGVISRTVRDTAAALDAVSGALPGDLSWLPPTNTPFLESLEPPGQPLRVGLLTEGPAGLPIDSEIVRAVEETGALLQHAGHQVEASHPPALLEPTPEWVERIWDDNFIEVIDQLATLLGRPVTEDDVEPYTWHRYKPEHPVSAAELRAGLNWHLGRSARLLEWWEQGFDLLVTPVTSVLPERLVDLAAQSPETTNARCGPFMMPFNASGQPAVAFPVRWTSNDIPVGVQIAAAKGADRLLLQVAAQLEEAIGWPSRTPSLDAQLEPTESRSPRS